MGVWVKNVVILFVFSKFPIISIFNIYGGKRFLKRGKGQILQNNSSVTKLEALAEKLFGEEVGEVFLDILLWHPSIYLL